MRYHTELPLTASPCTEASTFTRSPGTSVPTTGAFVDAAARTFACDLGLPHQPVSASSAEGIFQLIAHSLLDSASECRLTYPSVVDHHVAASPSMPGDAPVTRSRSPFVAVRRIGSFVFGCA